MMRKRALAELRRSSQLPSVGPGFVSQRYHAAVAGMSDTGNSATERLVYGALATGMVAPTTLEDMGRSLINAPGLLVSAGENATQVFTAPTTEGKIIGGLTALRDGSFGLLGLAPLVPVDAMMAPLLAKGSAAATYRLGNVGNAGPTLVGVPINGATRTVPLGFNPPEQFTTAAQRLQGALVQSGVTDATVGVRGSSVTGVSLTKGKRFGPQSDIDFYVESQQLTDGYTTSKNIPGFVHPGKILPDYPLLQDWATTWTKTR